jgi:pSer/pThr/pTyr-binding forkhead associated (FHA) protein
MTAPSGVTTELQSGVTVLGRGAMFGITDRRVSRKHAEVTVSKETNTVTLMSVPCPPFPPSPICFFFLGQNSFAENLKRPQ